MAYCIMHVEKQKGSAVRGLQIEANRNPDKYKFDRSDIDEARTRENIFLRKTDNWKREIDREIKEAGVKARKDSVMMITAVYSASHEFFDRCTRDEMLDYFSRCLEFHDRTYGTAFNAVVHMDESNPHLHVASVPLVFDDRGAHLSAKMIMGGRMDYRAKQDAFYEEVGKVYSLERGIKMLPGEQKRRVEARDWKIQQQEKQLGALRESLEIKQLELKDITAKIQDGIDTQVKALKAGYALDRDKVKVYRNQYEYLVDFANGLKSYLDNLTTTSMMTHEAYEEVKSIRATLDAQIEEEVVRRYEAKIGEVKDKLEDDMRVAEARRERYEHLCEHQEELIDKGALKRAERVLKGIGEDVSKIRRMEAHMKASGVWDAFKAKEDHLLDRTRTVSRSR